MSMEMTNTNLSRLENGFYFRRPELDGKVSPGVELAVALGAMASRQVLEVRTRTHHPDGRAENVAEHSHMLSRVATGLYRNFKHLLPEQNEGMIGLFADIHDDVEAYVLDTATDFISDQGRREKEIREAAGARQLYVEYHDIDPIYAERIRTYEEQVDPNARFVRVVDKMMTLLIHLPNKGEIIRKTFNTKEAHLEAIYKHTQRLREQFPEFVWLLDLRDELGEYVNDVAFDNT